MDADLADRLQRLMKSESLTASGDAEDNSQLLSELDEFLQSEAARLSELRSACDGQGGNCAPCVDGCRCRGPADAACACSHCCRSRSSPRAAGRKPGPGQGAVSRGRGEAPLTWGDEATDQNIRFRESILPAGSDETPTDQIIGITAANPDDELTDAGPRSAAQRASAVSGDQFWRRVIRPRHRSVVRGYFDSVPTPDTRQ